MLKISSQKNSTIISDSLEPNKIVETIKDKIDSNGEVTVDISEMSLLDACKISVLCSTEQYIKNPKSHINWIVSSSSVADVASSLSLGNSSFLCD